MILGVSGNMVVSALLTMGFQCGIHQMKGKIFLRLLIQLMLKITMKV